MTMSSNTTASDEAKKIEEIINNLQHLKQNPDQLDKYIPDLCYINSLTSQIINKVNNFHIQIPKELKEQKIQPKKKKKKRRRLTPGTLKNETTIVIHNLVTAESNWEEEKHNIINGFFKHKLDVAVTPINIFKMCKKTSKGPIGVLLKNKHEKMEIYRNCYKLKTTNIRIQDYLTKEEMEERKIFYTILKEEKLKGKKISFKGTTLYVDNIPIQPKPTSTLHTDEDSDTVHQCNVTAVTPPRPPSPNLQQYQLRNPTTMKTPLTPKSSCASSTSSSSNFSSLPLSSAPEDMIYFHHPHVLKKNESIFKRAFSFKKKKA